MEKKREIKFFPKFTGEHKNNEDDGNAKLHNRLDS